MPSHLLSWIVFAPLVGMATVLVMPRPSPWVIRLSCLMPAFVPLLLTTAICFSVFQAGMADLQLVERVDWIRSIRAEYCVGIDGLSLSLVWLTSLAMFIAVAANLSVAMPGRAACALLLLLEFGIFGALVSQDLFLLFAFLELTLIPICLSIGIWGGVRRVRVASSWMLVTLVGSILILVAIVALRLGGGTFSIPTLVELARSGKLSGANLTEDSSLFGIPFASWCFALLLLGLGIKFSAAATLLVAPRRFALPVMALLAPVGLAIARLVELWRAIP